MYLLSLVRLGVNLGRITDVDLATINELFLLTQPAHLQKIHGREMEPSSGRGAGRRTSAAGSGRPTRTWPTRDRAHSEVGWTPGIDPVPVSVGSWH